MAAPSNVASLALPLAAYLRTLSPSLAAVRKQATRSATLRVAALLPRCERFPPLLLPSRLWRPSGTRPHGAWSLCMPCSDTGASCSHGRVRGGAGSCAVPPKVGAPSTRRLCAERGGGAVQQSCSLTRASAQETATPRERPWLFRSGRWADGDWLHCARAVNANGAPASACCFTHAHTRGALTPLSRPTYARPSSGKVPVPPRVSSCPTCKEAPVLGTPRNSHALALAPFPSQSRDRKAVPRRAPESHDGEYAPVDLDTVS